MAQNDPQAAASLAQSLPEGQIRNNSIAQVSNQMLQSDPASAMQLVSTITDEGLKNSMQIALAVNWLHNDPSAAILWVNDSTLSDQAKKTILRQK